MYCKQPSATIKLASASVSQFFFSFLLFVRWLLCCVYHDFPSTRKGLYPAQTFPSRYLVTDQEFQCNG